MGFLGYFLGQDGVDLVFLKNVFFGVYGIVVLIYLIINFDLRLVGCLSFCCVFIIGEMFFQVNVLVFLESFIGIY